MKRSVNTALTNDITVYWLRSEKLSYVEPLNRYFLLRKKRDPKYSLRRFASELGLTPMHLSHILSGQRGLSRKKAEHVATVLKLSYKERRVFLLIVSALSARRGRERHLAQLGLRNYLISSRVQ